MRRGLPFLLVVLLAGCTDPAPGPDPAAPDTAPAGVEAAEPVPMGFAGAAFEATASFEGAFGATDNCLIQVSGAVECRPNAFDLTAMLPALTPVEVTLTLEAQMAPGGFAHVLLDLQDASASGTGFSDDGRQLTAVVVRQDTGSVAAVAVQVLPSFAPPQETPFRLEVRAVFRPEVVPTFLPAGVELRRGESLTATGDGLDDLVVVPPGRPPIHLLGPFGFNVSDEFPEGRYIVVAKGTGDVVLAGPNRTLVPLVAKYAEGDPQPITSGQVASWDFTVPGVPLYVGFVIQGSGSPLGDTTIGQTQGDYRVVLTEGAVEILAVTSSCAPAPFCQANPVGSSSESYFGDYLDERMGLGPFTVAADFELANSIEVHEVMAWLEA